MMRKIIIVLYGKVFSSEGHTYGPGLRAYGLALALKNRGHEVYIAEFFHDDDFTKHGIVFVGWNKKNLKELLYDKDCAIFVISSSRKIRDAVVKNYRIPLVIDLFIPTLIELSDHFSKSSLRLTTYKRAVYNINELLLYGDYFICAGQRQRIFYLGALGSLGRLSPITYEEDMLGVIPLSSGLEPPIIPEKPLIRGKVLSENKKIILWPGGVYPHFDAVIPIRAFVKLKKQRSDVALVFVGSENPFGKDMFKETLNLYEQELIASGLYGESIFTVPWIPYNQRAAMYAESDIALVTQRNTYESLLSFRTRVVDCLWGGIPVISNEGDEITELLEKYGAGISVPFDDENVLCEVLNNILDDEVKRNNMRDNAKLLYRKKFDIDKNIEPLAAFCENPQKAKDFNYPSGLKGILIIERAFRDCIEKILLVMEGCKYIKEKGLRSFINKI